MTQLLTGKMRDASASAEFVTISVELEPHDRLVEQLTKPLVLASKVAKLTRSSIEMEFPQFDNRISDSMSPVFGVGARINNATGLSDTLHCVKTAST